MLLQDKVNSIYKLILEAYKTDKNLEKLSEEDLEDNNESLILKNAQSEDDLDEKLKELLVAGENDVIIRLFEKVDSKEDDDFFDFVDCSIVFNTQGYVDEDAGTVDEFRLIPIMMPIKYKTISDGCIQKITQEVAKSYSWPIKELKVGKQIWSAQDVFDMSYSDIYASNTMDINKYVNEDKENIATDFVNIYGLRFIALQIKSDIDVQSDGFLNLAEIEESMKDTEEYTTQYMNNIHEIFNEEFNALCIVERFANVYDARGDGVRIKEIFSSQMKLKEQLQLNDNLNKDKVIYVSMHGILGETYSEDIVSNLRVSIVEEGTSNLLAGYTLDVTEYVNEDLATDIILNVASFLNIETIFDYDVERILTNIPLNMYYDGKSFKKLEV